MSAEIDVIDNSIVEEEFELMPTSAPTQLKLVGNPPSQVCDDVTDHDIDEAILLHCRRSMEQNAAMC